MHLNLGIISIVFDLVISVAIKKSILNYKLVNI
jgi:hypothetical protein